MFFKKIKLLFITILICMNSFANDLKPVTIQLSWFNQFQFAGYYIAKEKGFYEDLGLDVTIKAFEFDINISKEVSLGNLDFAVGRETLILDRKDDQKIVALYALFQATPLILISTKESNINSISDFTNKRIMTTIDDASEVSLKSMISSHSVKLSDLNFLKHSHDINDLINKNTDVISAYLSKAPFELDKKGIEFNIFDPKKYGFDMYSDFLFTSEKLINNDVKTVNAFKKASLKGWEYAYNNIEESSELIVEKYNSQNLSKEALIYEGLELKKLSYFKTRKLGEIKKEKVQRIYDLYNVMGLSNKNLNIDDFIHYDKSLKNLKFTQKDKAYLKNKKEIKMCVVPDLMPLSDIKDGKFIGFIADYIYLIEEKLGIPIFLVETRSLSQSLEYIKNKRCDIIPSLVYTKKRDKYLNFTQSYFELPYVIITKNSQSFIYDIKTLEHKNISIPKNYAISNILKHRYRNINFVEVENLEDGLDKVLSGKVFAHIGINATASYKLKRFFYNELKISGKIDDVNHVRMAVEEEDKVLLKILNKIVINTDEETRLKILNKWLALQDNDEFDYKLLWQVLFIVSLVFLAIIYNQFLLKKMNKALHLKVEEKTKELVLINNELENRIKKAVDENIRKDRIMSQQSKMAAIGEMMENIAHQWRQPLSLITTGASGIKLKKELGILEDEFLLATLKSIISSASNLSKTIDDFRDFFKPTREKTKISLLECCNKTLDLLNSKMKSKNIRIIRNIESIKINTYESELIQVFISILSNSRDAFKGTKFHEKLIFIDIYKENNFIIIKILDNAGGVKKEIIDKIFEPYFTTKHKSHGTGIGLYMCLEILSKHMNGKIEVKNKKYKYDDISYIGLETTIIL